MTVDEGDGSAGAVGSTAQPEGTGGDVVRVTAWVTGRVQGVGFRWWTRSRALELGLMGWARNAVDGRVEIVAEGPTPRCQALLDAVRSGRSPGRVDEVVERFSPAKGGLSGFVER